MKPCKNKLTTIATGLSFLMPFAYRVHPNNHYMHKILVLFLTCAPTFVILTISYEGLFYLSFSAILVSWVRLEHAVYKFVSSQTSITSGPANGTANGGTKAASRKQLESTNHISRSFRPLTLNDARVALFFFVLLQSAFFSTGNVASVSAFSLGSVSRLIPIFDPWSQGAMLILKLLIPFALISANLGILNKRLGVAPSALFMLVMAVSDILTLYFFWVVKDEGSWLEIGSTISHFVIASGLGIFVSMLEGVSAVFISGVDVGEDAIKAVANGAAERSPDVSVDGVNGNGGVEGM